MGDDVSDAGASARDVDKPDVTIVIPVHNEQGILRACVKELSAALAGEGWQSEVVLAEYGSSDATPRIASELAPMHPGVVAFSRRR